MIASEVHPLHSGHRARRAAMPPPANHAAMAYPRANDLERF